jgi:hypothetical protein
MLHRALLLASVLLLCLSTCAWAQAPVGPVPPKAGAFPSVESLQKAIEAIEAPAGDRGWSDMTAEERQRTLGDLKKVTDQIRDRFGLPVGPVAPNPVAPTPSPGNPAPGTQPGQPNPPPSPSDKELESALKELSSVLHSGQKKPTAISPLDAQQVQQILNKVQKGGPY